MWEEAQTDEKVIASILHGKIELLLISPESLLLNQRFRGMLLSKPYKLSFIDWAQKCL